MRTSPIRRPVTSALVATLVAGAGAILAGSDEDVRLTPERSEIGVVEGEVALNGGAYDTLSGDTVELTVTEGTLRIRPPAAIVGYFAERPAPDFGAGRRAALPGDLDGDGNVDVFATYADTAARVWLGDGAGRFMGGAEVPGTSGLGPGIELADLDGDGDLDLLWTSSPRPDRVEIWSNAGAAGFAPAASLVIASGRRVTPVDVDDDGDLDLLATRTDGTWVYVVEGLVPMPMPVRISELVATAHAAADLDGDGDTDLILGVAPHRTGAILFRNGLTQTYDPVDLDLPDPGGVDDFGLGDLDGDGDPDLVIDVVGWRAYVRRNDGNGGFSPWAVLHSRDASGTSVIDLDGDGDPDVRLGDRIYLNDGQGALTDSDQAVTADPLPAVAIVPWIGDLDGDGLPDIFAPRTSDSVWLNGTRAGRWWWTRAGVDGPDETMVTLMGMTGSGATAEVSWSVSVSDVPPHLMAAADQTFSSATAAVELGFVTDAGADGPYGVTIDWGDGSPLEGFGMARPGRLPAVEHTFPGEGEYDVSISARAQNGVGSDPDELRVTIGFEAEVEVVHLGPPRLTVDEGQTVTTVGIVREPAGVVALSTDLGVIELDPTESTTVYRATGQTRADRPRPGLGDLDGDGDLDLLWFDFPASATWLNDGTGRFETSPRSLPRGWPAGGRLADLDGDGDLDAVVTRIGVVFSLFNDGNGRLAPGEVFALDRSDHPSGIAVGDLDGDGDVDAIVTYRPLPPGYGDPYEFVPPSVVLLNRGDGSFVDGRRPIANGGDIELADLDGDGDLDAFIEAGSAINFVCVNDGLADFDCRVVPGCPIFVGSIALGDLDGDGDLDAFVGCVSWVDPVYGGEPSPGLDRVLWNDGSGGFTDSGQRLAGGTTASVALGDLDGDGDLDAWVGGPSTTIWRNDGSGRFEDSGLVFDAGSAALADLDGDGVLDAAGHAILLAGETQRGWRWSWDSDDGPAELAVEVRLGDGAAPVSATGFTVEVANLPPKAVHARLDSVGDCGRPLQVTAFGFDDPSAVDAAAGFTTTFGLRPSDGPALSPVVVSPGRPAGGPVTILTPPGLLSGDDPARVTITLADKDGGTATTSVQIVDEVAPTGSIVVPQPGACYGEPAVPLFVQDDFTDRCGAPLQRTYLPVAPGQGPFSTHGNHSVRLEVSDAAGNRAADEVHFTIDLVRPAAVFIEPAEQVDLPAALPLAIRFISSDHDGADGGVLHESMTLGGCPLFNGAVFGNADGLLADEDLTLTRKILCSAVRRCDLQDGFVWLRLGATDCANNRFEAQTRIRLDAAAACSPDGVTADRLP